MRISFSVPWTGLWALGSLLLLSASSASAQYRRPVDDAAIQSVMPAADSFSVKAGLPPVYTAYGPRSEGSPRNVVGYVYLTSNVPPTVYGYSSRIDVLVGMDLLGNVTGMHIVNYRESLSSSRGDFLRGAGLEEQILGKHISEAFQVGRDLHGVSGASISARAMYRGIRNSARRVALAYLQPDEATVLATAGALEELTWAPDDFDWLHSYDVHRGEQRGGLGALIRVYGRRGARKSSDGPGEVPRRQQPCGRLG